MPQTFKDLIILITTNFVFLGALSTFLLDQLWNLLTTLGKIPTSNEKRIISIILPFLVVIIFYLLGMLVGYINFDVESLYQGLLNAFQVSLGGQLIYGGYKLTKEKMNDKDPI